MSIFSDEKIVETKSCQKCQTSFDITDKDLEFYDSVSPTIDEKKYSIPTPSLCSDCRSQRRMSWSNQMQLYKRKCDATGKDILSNVSEDKPHKVYEVREWYSDHWDQNITGRDYNFERGFFEQFQDLLQVAPFPNLQRSPGYDENAEYTNYASKNRDCYLVFDSDGNRDVSYSYSTNSCENAMDVFRVGGSGYCYESIDSRNCYNSKYLQNSNDCNNSQFLFDCIGCEFCFGCVNLRNKKYHIYNVEHSKQEYEEKIKELSDLSLVDIQGQFEKLKVELPHRSSYGIDNTDVLGNYLVNSKDSKHCYDCRNLNECKYIQQSFDDATRSMDCTEIGDKAELLYEAAYTGINSYNNKFVSHVLGDGSNLTYCFFTPFCSNCFGCVGLHHKEYNIFNKQYTKEQYYELLSTIIAHMQDVGEWGEFFPADMSPWGYNESHANDYFPLNKKQARESGFNWSDYQAPLPKVDKTIPANKLPKNITEIPDDILNWAIECGVTQKPFRIIPQELQFYRKHNLPIPRRHPDQRHLDRMALRNPRKLFKRGCDKCDAVMQTTYSPERPEKVYCEECYSSEIY
ncbi:hypothetical protein OAN96_01060 [Candidatus Gracilibacteria bacterium]|nr:hypothetical protein [Candidatus Gracilibacteria bacterium]